MWTGGIVGLKSILGVKRRDRALWIIHELEDMGYLKFSLDVRTKKLSYELNDWVPACTGGETQNGSVYATEDFGFIGLVSGICAVAKSLPSLIRMA